MNQVRIYIYVVAAMTGWALSFVWVKIAYISFNPIGLVETRLLLATILMFLLVKVTGKFQPIQQGHFKYFAILAFFEPFLYFMGESFGMNMVSPTLGAVIISTIPLFAPVTAYFFMGEKPTWFILLGILISMAGTMLIAWQPGVGFNASVPGILLMFLAVISAVFYTVFLKKLTEHYYGLTIIFYQNLFGMVYFLPVFLYVEMPQFFTVEYKPEAIRAMVLLTVFASVAAFIFFTAAIKKLGVTRSNAFINLIPAITALFSYFILKEEISVQKVFGVIVVIAGLYLGQMSKNRILNASEQSS